MTRILSAAASTLVILTNGACSDTGSHDSDNNNGGSGVFINHWIEAITYDATTNSVTVHGLYEPSDSLLLQCGQEPEMLGASATVHLVPLADNGSGDLMVEQYSSATPIDASELAERVEQVPYDSEIQGNAITLKIEQQDIDEVWVGMQHNRTQPIESNTTGVWCNSIYISYSNGTHRNVSLYCGACGTRGTCGDAWCDPGEEDTCWDDCLPACLPDCSP